MERKKEIVFATLELAADKGLGNVSMQQIADRVGITKASLYNHFSSKDEIVEAMYDVLRNETKKSAGVTDPAELIDGRSLEEILTIATDSYRRMCTDPQMLMFYKVIMSERAIDPKAAEIMISETKTMINATRMLFYALQVKGLAFFDDPDHAAVSFAMAVHSIIDHGFDLKNVGMSEDDDMLGDYIRGFCRIYGKRGDAQ